jgi:hypothetical protein
VILNLINFSDLCIHRISKAGFDAILKNRQSAKCPVAGCKTQWTRSNGRPDNEFRYQMERFYRVKEATAPNAGATQVDVELDDGDDDGYTQL